MTGEAESLHQRVLFLSRQYGPLVYRIARRYADTPAEVDDLTQDIWVRVIDILPRKNPVSPMEGWLCVVAANVGLEHRKRVRRAARFKHTLSFLLPRVDNRQPEQASVPQTTSERIWKAIDSLPNLQRQVVLHRVFEGLSTDETARAIQRAEGTVKASLHRALKALAIELADLEASWSADDL
jgi:RNA polymerase sigma-70 factor (ECF subfamily)